ncbi:hypothetical protein LSAT2_019176 [Lamellibrachia satsuma]|nr:hypothetical protein LSAT2_019176 [Lamellibrachia satsuma]
MASTSISILIRPGLNSCRQPTALSSVRRTAKLWVNGLRATSTGTWNLNMCASLKSTPGRSDFFATHLTTTISATSQLGWESDNMFGAYVMHNIEEAPVNVKGLAVPADHISLPCSRYRAGDDVRRLVEPSCELKLCDERDSSYNKLANSEINEVVHIELPNLEHTEQLEDVTQEDREVSTSSGIVTRVKQEMPLPLGTDLLTAFQHGLEQTVALVQHMSREEQNQAWHTLQGLVVDKSLLPAEDSAVSTDKSLEYCQDAASSTNPTESSTNLTESSTNPTESSTNNRKQYQSNRKQYQSNRKQYQSNRKQYQSNRKQYQSNRKQYQSNRKQYQSNRKQYQSNRKQPLRGMC